MKFSRYLVWNFLKMLFLIFIGALVMFIVIDFVGNIRSWSNRETSEIIEYYKCYSPYIIFLISPVALFLAVIASVGNMSKHLELTAIQSSGRSMFRALMPIFFFGLLFTLLSFILSETIMPESNHKRLEIMETSAQKKKNERVKDKRDFAFIDSDRASWFFKYYSSVSKAGREVSLLLKNEGHLVERYDAKRIHWGAYEPPRLKPSATQKVEAEKTKASQNKDAKKEKPPVEAVKKNKSKGLASTISQMQNSLAEAAKSVESEKIDSLKNAQGDSAQADTTAAALDSVWILENGHQRKFLEDGSVETISFIRMPLLGVIATRPNDLINERQTGDEMNSREVKHRIEVLRRSGEDTRTLETAYHYKFAGPWTNFFVLLIGAALCHRFSRSGGLSQKFGIGIFFVFSYYILIRLGLKMGENIDPIVGAYGPHVVFAIIACIMLYRSFRL